ncbi:MAG TPA: hypothetical protein VH498_00240 [Candidatus Dormibacteraeota bacterium]|nr:hypothetical protein [Candidatus Dormibacteraeota bacterium]
MAEWRSLAPGDQPTGRAVAAELHAVPRSAIVGRIGEVACLALAPVVVFFGLQVRAMPRISMIDPYFYGAYALDGTSMLQRFGTGNYFWPRVGFILPDRLFITLFGPLGGFFSFRYVLALVATVPMYILFKQLFGRWAGALVVLVILTAPVVLSAWGSDYPDSSAVSYLAAGAACAFILGKTDRTQVVWAFGAGLFMGLAINSQVVAGFTIAGILVGWLLSARADPRRLTATRFASMAAGGLTATVALVFFTAVTMGQWDIFKPTVHAILQYRQPNEIALFHSSTWRWLIDDIYVLVPPALVAAWVVAAWPVFGRADISRAELGFAAATAVAFVLHALAQFVAKNWTLEYYLYTSMLWALVCPLLTFTVLRLARARPAPQVSRGALVLAAAALLGIPLVLRVFRDQLQLGFGVALAMTAVPAIGGLLARSTRLRRVGSVAAVICVTAASTLLVVGVPENPTIYPGQVAYFTPDYGTALFGDGRAAVDRYAVFANLHTVVPTYQQVPGDLAMWWPAQPSQTVNVASAQYLWILEGLPSTLPALDDATRADLVGRHPSVLVLLSDTGNEFDVAEQSLAAGGFAPHTYRDATLTSGSDVLHVRVLVLGAFAPH